MRIDPRPPSLWRDYLTGPIRTVAWMAVGVIPTTIAGVLVLHYVLGYYP